MNWSAMVGETRQQRKRRRRTWRHLKWHSQRISMIGCVSEWLYRVQHRFAPPPRRRGPSISMSHLTPNDTGNDEGRHNHDENDRCDTHHELPHGKLQKYATSVRSILVRGL